MAVNGVEIKHGQVWLTHGQLAVQVLGRQLAVQDQKTQGWLVKRCDGFYPEYFVTEGGIPLGEHRAGRVFHFSLRNLLHAHLQVDFADTETTSEPPSSSGGGKLDRKSNYYQVQIKRPVGAESEPYLAECADIIEALNMTFNEGEAFKALWRLAAARQGKTKVGGEPAYDADKVAHYGARVAAQTRAQKGGAQ